MSISLKANSDGSSELLNGSTKVMTIGADNKLYDKDGVKLVSGEALGVGQTWQNVTASRAFGTTYTNTTGKPISVMFVGSNAGTNTVITVNSNNISAFISGTGQPANGSFIVPNGQTYLVSVGAGTIVSWWELR